MIQTQITNILSMVGPLVLIGGPCVIESLDFTLKMAEQISVVRAPGHFLHLQIFLDKANRTSVQSFRGQTVETGLKILQRVKDEIGVPVLTDIHESYAAW